MTLPAIAKDTCIVRNNFLWMMAANRERHDREYGAANVQPEFAAVPTGLDKGR
jgi:hypothetical protein